MSAAAVPLTTAVGGGARAVEGKLGPAGPADKQPGHSLLFAGAAATLGRGALDEELHIRGSSVAWAAGGVLRKQLGGTGPVLRAAWCFFQNTGPEPVLCLLHHGALSVHTHGGDVHHIPLPGAFTALWPLPQGVLLTGAPEQGPCILVHPLENIQEVQMAGPGSTGAAGTAGGPKLLLRVTATNTLDQEAREERVGYHCYRGMLTPETQLFFHTPEELATRHRQQQQQQQQQQSAQTPEAPSSAAEGAPSSDSSGCEDGALSSAPQAPQSAAATRGSVALLNARQRPSAGSSRSAVSIYTSDGEWFPVKRQLLRPCIALTKAVRAEEPDKGGAAPEATVDVDCLTFDRVLIFLEALALGKDPPAFGLHLCPQLLAAAQRLGLRPLEEYCRERLGESQSRLRCYSFDEIQALNAAGGCWLILDGMVLDVTRWLPEHPGGSRIIPAQSLNLDCSRQFELYHASRESFVYLRQFYMGEIASTDRELVPKPSPPPSTDFLQQLREYTPWRMKVDAAEPAARTHLGAKRSSSSAVK